MASRFQFTLPCRERQRISYHLLMLKLFQFTLPCRERRKQAEPRSRQKPFQFTLPCRERPSRQPNSSASTPSFNSRSRVGSDATQDPSVADNLQFQFTLPCRERRDGAPYRRPRRVFQFTLPCRERLRLSKSGRVGLGFNSRSRVGSDAGGLPIGYLVRVSIHAPV